MPENFSLPDQMQAAVLHGTDDVRLETIARPVAGPGELVIRVEAATTCGTDVKVMRRGGHPAMITPPAAFGQWRQSVQSV